MSNKNTSNAIKLKRLGVLKNKNAKKKFNSNENINIALKSKNIIANFIKLLESKKKDHNNIFSHFGNKEKYYSNLANSNPQKINGLDEENSKNISDYNENNNNQSKHMYTENLLLKKKFLEALEANKNNKKHFQVVYMFKKKIKRMFRIDCITRKINV